MALGAGGPAGGVLFERAPLKTPSASVGRAAACRPKGEALPARMPGSFFAASPVFAYRTLRPLPNIGHGGNDNPDKGLCPGAKYSILNRKATNRPAEQGRFQKGEAVMAKFTYYGGMAVLAERSDGFKILFDPYIHNSLCRDVQPSMFYDVDLIVLTHAAFDHFGETVDILRHSKATLLCGAECWAKVLAQADIPESRHINVIYGDGGQFGPTSIRVVPAWHGSNVVYDGITHAYYPFGMVAMIEPGVSFYHTGDTCLFSDMQLVRELYRPTVMMVCISTIDVRYGSIMSTREAAQAVRWVGPDLVLPGHYYAGDPALEEFKLHMRSFAPDTTVYTEVGKPVEYIPYQIRY